MSEGLLLQFAPELAQLRDGVDGVLAMDGKIRCNLLIAHDGTEGDGGGGGRGGIVEIEVRGGEASILR